MNTYDLFYRADEFYDCGYYLSAVRRDEFDTGIPEHYANDPEYKYVSTIEIPEPDKKFVIDGIVEGIDKELAALEVQANQLKQKKSQVLALEAK